MRRLIMVVAIVALLLVAGCGQQVNAEEPPKIVYGQDVCDRCGMIVNEENFAAAYWTKAGEARRFDDIGGMLAYNTEESEDVVSFWVHDFVNGEWIRAEEATLLFAGDLMTPMGFGIAAFADEAQAEAFGHGLDKVMIMPFSEVLAMDITMPMAPTHSMEASEHGD